VNDRVDVALAAGAAGAHLGWDDLPLAAARAVTPPGFILGISVGSPDEAARARGLPADYWSVGPCYATGTKADAGAPLGAEGFAAGGAGVAVAAAVFGATDPATAAAAVLVAVSP
jgi:thiamine-phosphate pyrophosphorylase